MSLHLRTIHERSDGIALLEFIGVTAITGIIVVGMTATVYQLVFQRSHTQDSMMATTQVHNSEFWLSRDGLVSQDVEIGDNPATPANEVLTLTWSGWERKDAQDNEYIDLHEVLYTFDSNELSRYELVKTDKYNSEGTFISSSTSNTTSPIAENITEITANKYDNRLVMSLKAVVDDVESQKSFEILPRTVPY